MLKNIYYILLVLLLLACKEAPKTKNNKLNIVTTTTMITDLVKQIGGDRLNVVGLMGSGVDPHLYKASGGDIAKISDADVIIYNGLHLEGKLEDIFEKMRTQNKTTIAVSDTIPRETLITSEYFASNYDPHIWFDIENWKLATQFLVSKISILDPENASVYQKNGAAYLIKLNELSKEINHKISELPEDKRILVTAHDAFNYFGKSHHFNVVGLQGLSTVTEAGVQDVQNLAKFIIENQVKAIFVESSVPKRTIAALQAAVKAKGHDVIIGGTLYSDALGNSNTPEGTYIGMYIYNVNTIINALK